MVKELNGNMAKIKREVLLEWTKSMDSSVFDEATIDKLSYFIKNKTFTMKVRDYIINFFEMPDMNRNYIISCDVSGGLSQDNSALCIVDPGDFHVVGTFRNNKIDTENYKLLIKEIMENYFQNAFLIVESNSYGLNILQALSKIPNIESRMYQEEKEQLGEKTLNHGAIVKRKTKTFKYGVDTTSKSRKLMLELLPEIVENEPEKIISPDLYDEIRNLEVKKNGKIEHSDTSHDDLLMSYLFVRYALMYGSFFKKHGISAIASATNVKTSLISENIQRMHMMIERANMEEFSKTELQEMEANRRPSSGSGSLLNLMLE